VFFSKSVPKSGAGSGGDRKKRTVCNPQFGVGCCYTRRTWRGLVLQKSLQSATRYCHTGASTSSTSPRCNGAYIAWFLVALSILVSAFFTILYSFECRVRVSGHLSPNRPYKAYSFECVVDTYLFPNRPYKAYSFEWGREKSISWLTAFLLSFAESIILIQPLKVTNDYVSSFVLCNLRTIIYTRCFVAV